MSSTWSSTLDYLTNQWIFMLFHLGNDAFVGDGQPALWGTFFWMLLDLLQMLSFPFSNSIALSWPLDGNFVNGELLPLFVSSLTPSLAGNVTAELTDSTFTPAYDTKIVLFIQLIAHTVGSFDNIINLMPNALLYICVTLVYFEFFMLCFVTWTLENQRKASHFKWLLSWLRTYTKLIMTPLYIPAMTLFVLNMNASKWSASLLNSILALIAFLMNFFISLMTTMSMYSMNHQSVSALNRPTGGLECSLLLYKTFCIVLINQGSAYGIISVYVFLSITTFAGLFMAYLFITQQPYYRTIFNQIRVIQLLIVSFTFICCIVGNIQFGIDISNIASATDSELPFYLASMYNGQLPNFLFLLGNLLVVYAGFELCSQKKRYLMRIKNMNRLENFSDFVLHVQSALMIEDSNMKSKDEEGENEENSTRFSLTRRKQKDAKLEAIMPKFEACMSKFESNPMFFFFYGIVQMYLKNDHLVASTFLHKAKEKMYVSSSAWQLFLNIENLFAVYKAQSTIYFLRDKDDFSIASFMKYQKLSRDVNDMQEKFFAWQSDLWSELLNAKDHFQSISSSNNDDEGEKDINLADLYLIENEDDQKLFAKVYEQISELGMSMITIHKNFQDMLKINGRSSLCLKNYSYYLLQVLNDTKGAQEFSLRSKTFEMENTSGNMKHSIEYNTKSVNAHKADLPAMKIGSAIFVDTNAVIVVSGDSGYEGEIVSCGGSCSNVFGYHQNELIGHNIQLLIFSPFAEKHVQYITNFMRTGKGNIVGKVRFNLGLTKSGYLVPFQICVRQILTRPRLSNNDINKILAVDDEFKRDRLEDTRIAFLAIIQPKIDTNLHYIVIKSNGTISGFTSGCTDIWGITPDHLHAAELKISRLVPTIQEKLDELQGLNDTSSSVKLTPKHNRRKSTFQELQRVEDVLIEIDTKQFVLNGTLTELKFEELSTFILEFTCNGVERTHSAQLQVVPSFQATQSSQLLYSEHSENNTVPERSFRENASGVFDGNVKIVIENEVQDSINKVSNWAGSNEANLEKLENNLGINLSLDIGSEISGGAKHEKERSVQFEIEDEKNDSKKHGASNTKLEVDHKFDSNNNVQFSKDVKQSQQSLEVKMNESKDKVGDLNEVSKDIVKTEVMEERNSMTSDDRSSATSRSFDKIRQSLIHKIGKSEFDRFKAIKWTIYLHFLVMMIFCVINSNSYIQVFSNFGQQISWIQSSCYRNNYAFGGTSAFRSIELIDQQVMPDPNQLRGLMYNSLVAYQQGLQKEHLALELTYPVWSASQFTSFSERIWPIYFMVGPGTRTEQMNVGDMAYLLYTSLGQIINCDLNTPGYNSTRRYLRCRNYVMSNPLTISTGLASATVFYVDFYTSSTQGIANSLLTLTILPMAISVAIVIFLLLPFIGKIISFRNSFLSIFLLIPMPSVSALLDRSSRAAEEFSNTFNQKMINATKNVSAVGRKKSSRITKFFRKIIGLSSFNNHHVKTKLFVFAIMPLIYNGFNILNAFNVVSNSSSGAEVSISASRFFHVHSACFYLIEALVETNATIASNYLQMALNASYSIEEAERSLIYGDSVNGIPPLLNTSPEQSSILFSEACVAGSPVDCATFDSSLFGNGLDSALQKFTSQVRVAAKMIDQKVYPIDNSQIQQIFNSYQIVFIMDMAHKYLEAPLDASTSIYMNQIENLKNQFLNSNYVATAIFVVLSITVLFWLILPLIVALERDIKVAKMALLMVPQDILTKMPFVYQYLSQLSAEDKL